MGELRMGTWKLIFATLIVLAGTVNPYSASAEAANWQKSGDWEYGRGSKLDMIWKCVGVTASDQGYLVLASYFADQVSEAELVPLVYSMDKTLFAEVPDEADVEFDGTTQKMKLHDYEDRPANELSFFLEKFESSFVSNLQSSQAISFKVEGKKRHHFSLRGVSEVLDYLKSCESEDEDSKQTEDLSQDSGTAQSEKVSYGQFGDWDVEYIDGDPVSAFSYGDQCSLSAQDSFGRADFSFGVFEDGPATITIFMDSMQNDDTWDLENRVTGKVYVNFDGMETETLVATMSPGWITISANDNPSFFELFIRQLPRKRMLRFVGSDQKGFGVADFQLDLTGSSKAMSALEECYGAKLK